jgi:hypothetical protein
MARNLRSGLARNKEARREAELARTAKSLRCLRLVGHRILNRADDCHQHGAPTAIGRYRRSCYFCHLLPPAQHSNYLASHPASNQSDDGIADWAKA